MKKSVSVLNFEAQKLSLVVSVFGLVRDGFSVYEIAELKGLSVEVVQRILSYSELYAAYRRILRENKKKGVFSKDTMTLYNALVGLC